jgi:protein-tyrosine-phosphatase
MCYDRKRKVKMRKKVLFVCTGNVCRSPMAEGIFRKMLEERGLAGAVDVDSAGTWALEGRPPTPLAVDAVAAMGVDIGDHRARTVTAEDLQEADLVLVMEEAHRRSLFYLAPELSHKVFLLSEMAGEHEEIADPYGTNDPENYVFTARKIRDYLERGWPEIAKRIGAESSA